jgi:hypothetical protein
MSHYIHSQLDGGTDAEAITGRRGNYRTPRQLPDAEAITGRRGNYQKPRQLPDAEAITGRRGKVGCYGKGTARGAVS